MRSKLREKVQQRETKGLCFARPIKFVNQSKHSTKIRISSRAFTPRKGKKGEETTSPFFDPFLVQNFTQSPRDVRREFNRRRLTISHTLAHNSDVVFILYSVPSLKFFSVSDIDCILNSISTRFFPA